MTKTGAPMAAGSLNLLVCDPGFMYRPQGNHSESNK